MKSGDISKIGDILRYTASTVVMPRFADLSNAEIRMKDRNEPVTIADFEAEAMIGSALLEILPGSRVVGEEACSQNPRLLETLGEGQVWLIDPIDGTANFAAGKSPFAMMVALLMDGEIAASWILDPLTDSIAVAERGSGAWIDGRRLNPSSRAPPLSQLSGIVSEAFCPLEQIKPLDSLCARVGEVFPTARCAGHEYPLVAAQRRDFALYWRTLPWDHAPGALLLMEAGGTLTYLDGTDFRPGLARSGLLLAINEQVSAVILAELGSSRPAH